MKKVVLTVALFGTFCLFSAEAKKNNKNSKKAKQTELVSSIDSLSYAFGTNLANQGLNQYLVQLEIITDTTQVNADFKNKIDEAASDIEKENLQKQLQTKIDSIESSNNANLESFINGIYERINIQGNNAHQRGIDLGSQIAMMSENFSDQNFGKNSDKLDLSLVVAGITDILNNKPVLIEDTEGLVQEKLNEAKAKKEQEAKALNANKISENERFMSENAKKQGVVSLPSGIQYIIEKEGKGEKPKASDNVKVHYSGTLLDGTEFDSSIKRGEPITFGVQQVIPGWTEVLQQMPVGSKWKVFIPYSLAYGETDMGPIPAYSNLIFEIELLDIEK